LALRWAVHRAEQDQAMGNPYTVRDTEVSAGVGRLAPALSTDRPPA